MKYLFPLLILGITACTPNQSVNNHALPFRPNILWLCVEDLGPYLAAFGDSTVHTPNLDRLAAEGIRYNRAFSVSGVCAVSRTALCTGMYPSGIGAHHMRTLYMKEQMADIGLHTYEVVPPPQVRMLSEILRANDYYTSNNQKEDHQFEPGNMAWDESSNYAHWRNRPAGKAFYSVFNFGVTHESQIFNPSPTWNFLIERDTFPLPRDIDPAWKRSQDYPPKPLEISENLDVPIPPYLPQTEMVQADVRRMYSNIVQMDRQVGIILRQLEEDGLMDSTIIVWFSDHGGPLPRQKRLLYDSGMQIPLIIRYPDQWRAGEIDTQMVSFVDFAPTTLSLASIPIPEYMQGRAFLGAAADSSDARKFVHASADRFDRTYDMIRAVRNKRFKYLRNFYPNLPYYLPLQYREQMATMQELLDMHEVGGLDSIQAQWFRQEKPREELFDTWNDPHELKNLAADPAFTKQMLRFRQECDRWMESIGDMGHIPEKDLIQTFWPEGIQPQTAKAEVELVASRLYLSCKTAGASIGYKPAGSSDPAIGWEIYQKSIDFSQYDSLEFICHRLGYAPSEVVKWVK